MCGSADCDQATFYKKLGDNSYIDLKVEFIIGEGNSGVDYIEPYDDRVNLVLISSSSSSNMPSNLD